MYINPEVLKYAVGIIFSVLGWTIHRLVGTLDSFASRTSHLEIRVAKLETVCEVTNTEAVQEIPT